MSMATHQKWEDVLYNMSFANIQLINRSIPTYDNNRKPDDTVKSGKTSKPTQTRKGMSFQGLIQQLKKLK